MNKAIAPANMDYDDVMRMTHSKEDPDNAVTVILEQERFMPIANISRIMKRVLPDRAKLSREAKECIQECVTEFLLFVTSEASENCNLEKRKTITGDDLLNSMETLGFDNYIHPLRTFMKRNREATRADRGESEDLENDIQNPSSVAPPSYSVPPQLVQQVIPQMYQPSNTQNQNTQPPTPAQSQVQQQQPESPVTPHLPPHFRQVTDIYIDTSNMQHYIHVDNPPGYIPIEIRATSNSGQLPQPLPAQYFENN